MVLRQPKASLSPRFQASTPTLSRTLETVARNLTPPPPTSRILPLSLHHAGLDSTGTPAEGFQMQDGGGIVRQIFVLVLHIV
jgi:hypothetical protein